MESPSISLVLFAVTIASFANGQDGKQSQSVILPIAARPGVSAALGRDVQPLRTTKELFISCN